MDLKRRIEQLGVLPEFLTLKQVQKLLNVSERSLYRILANPAHRKDLGALDAGDSGLFPK